MRHRWFLLLLLHSHVPKQHACLLAAMTFLLICFLEWVLFSQCRTKPKQTDAIVAFALGAAGMAPTQFKL